MRKEKGSSSNHILQLMLLLLLCDALTARTEDSISPATSPGAEPKPFLPFLAPLPTSDQCPLDFSSVESLMRKTATDCYDFFGPFLFNAVCCPQYYATMVVLIGQSSKYSGLLALDQAQAISCLLDLDNILEGRGTGGELGNVCSVYPANLTQGSCPVTHVNEFESIVNSTTSLLAACGNIDPASECCKQVCQHAIFDAATKLALKGSSASHGPRHLKDISTKIEDCKNIVLHWLASKLYSSSANGVVRVLLSCEINKVCPLYLSEVTEVSKACGGVISNTTSCCNAMGFYMSDLQYQNLLTDSQAVNCAISLGTKLQKANVTQNVYNLCQVKLMDFTVQVGSQGTKYNGCLLPDSPTDATYDNASGLGVTCDLNNNAEAPWPSNPSAPANSSCHKSSTP